MHHSIGNRLLSPKIALPALKTKIPPDGMHRDGTCTIRKGMASGIRKSHSQPLKRKSHQKACTETGLAPIDKESPQGFENQSPSPVSENHTKRSPTVLKHSLTNLNQFCRAVAEEHTRPWGAWLTTIWRDHTGACRNLAVRLGGIQSLFFSSHRFEADACRR